jgi:hypothetical protein
MPNEIQAQVLKPFGPRILKALVPKAILDTLNDQCDEIVAGSDHDKLDISNDLVGHVQEEWSCDIEQVPDFGNMLFLLTKGLYENFITESGQQQTDTPTSLVVHKSWFVRAFENDYNPTHMHTSGSYSCVLYLKVPDTISDTNSKNVNKTVTEGYIDFVYGASLVCCAGNLCIKPEVGDLYIFPAYLFHTAYPFYGPDERRSFSINMSLMVDNK